MLKINRKVEYGLVALKHMVTKQNGELTSVREICDVYNTPFDPVAHVMRLLNAEGLLKSEQGAHGGYRMVGDLEKISFADFIETIEGKLAWTDCQREKEENRCSLGERCNIVHPMGVFHKRLQELLRSISLADMLTDSSWLLGDPKKGSFPSAQVV